MSFGRRGAAPAAAAVLCCLVAGAAHGGPLDSIYDPPVLAQRQQLYPSWVLGVFKEEIQPALTPVERGRLESVRLVFPQSMAGWEPFGFRTASGTIELSIASLKFCNDLMLAYAWLGRHRYSLASLDDYLVMLSNWRSDQPPPPPLTTLRIPANARDDADTDRLATLLVRSAYLFIVLHELGHVVHGDNPSQASTPEIAQAQEVAADAFALDLMARMGTVPTGMAAYFQFGAAFMPNPVQYRDTAAYFAALKAQTHPMTTGRLRAVAVAIDERAEMFAIDRQPATLAQFRELSRLLRKSAALTSDPDMLRLAALRGATLEPRDLAPRRPGALLGIPPDARIGHGPFSGKLAGTSTVANVAFDLEMFLEEDAGQVRGTYATGSELGRIVGVVDGHMLSFTWRSGDQRGRGVLRNDGTAYDGSAGHGTAIDGATWSLRRVPID